MAHPLSIGVCGEEGGWSSARLVEAFGARGASVRFFEPKDCSLALGEGGAGAVLHRGAPLPRFDAVVVKKIGDVTARGIETRLEVLYALERLGARVRSRPAAIERALNRVRNSRILSEHGIPMPATLVTDGIDEALAFVARHRAAVLKPAYTSKGRGMKRLDAARLDEARATLAAAQQSGEAPLYVQAFVERGADHDLGVAILDGRVLGGYRRIAPAGAWLTTIASGGRYGATTLSPEIEQLALKAAAPFGLTFTGVDVVETASGPMVYEVSAFGGFRGLWETQGIDAAALYAAHVLEEA